jgi:glyoxylase-like metal-dependent hydrolase (beta-lactamase superfamily II)
MYRIHPIRTGTLTSPKDAFTYLFDRETDVVIPTLSFLLEPTDPDRPTCLVDTGVRAREDEYIERHDKIVGPPYGGPEPLLDGLAERDVDAGEVDHVILTHLHHDHVANVDQFPDAEFVCQRDEWEVATDPLPLFDYLYPDEEMDWLADHGVTLVDGETTLADGIDLVPTPGHTEGSQSVVVETEAGPHALIADLAYTRHNLDPGREYIVDAAGRYLPATPAPELSYIPPGLHVDVEAAYDSIERLRDRVGPDGVIIPGHDAEYHDEYPA